MTALKKLGVELHDTFNFPLICRIGTALMNPWKNFQIVISLALSTELEFSWMAHSLPCNAVE